MRRLKALAAITAALMLVATAAFGDHFDADPDEVDVYTVDEPGQPASAVVAVALVADNDGDGQSPVDCDLDHPTQERSVTASVSSANTAVATVLPAQLVFSECGVPQNITITAQGCGQTTITIEMESTTVPGQSGTFTEESIAVTVDGNDCENGGELEVCSEPAAPAWANAFLKRTNIKGKQHGELVSSVARNMGKGATFEGVAKSQQEAYAQAVLDFLKANAPSPGNQFNALTVASSARPGWACDTTTA